MVPACHGQCCLGGWQKGLGVSAAIGRVPASLGMGRSLETCYQRARVPGRQQPWVQAHQQGFSLEKNE